MLNLLWANLNRSADVFVHLETHLVHVVSRVVVHDCVRAHEQHVALKIERRSNLAAVDALPDRLQIDRSATVQISLEHNIELKVF